MMRIEVVTFQLCHTQITKRGILDPSYKTGRYTVHGILERMTSFTKRFSNSICISVFFI